MISTPISAAKSTGLYPHSSTNSANQGVWSSSTEPMEPPHLVDRSEATYLPERNAGMPSGPPLPISWTPRRPRIPGTHPEHGLSAPPERHHTPRALVAGSRIQHNTASRKVLLPSARIGKESGGFLQGSPGPQFTPPWRTTASLPVSRSV